MMYRRMNPKQLEELSKVINESEINEDHPVWKAIDSGGGQTCDVAGVIRVLYKRGYTINRR